jgi:DNA-binding CsgD family transcriptional regulator
MRGTEAVVRGREAFAREAWSDACAFFLEADRATPLEADDLDRLATAAFLVGNETVHVDARARAHQAFADRGDTVRAARSAFWLAFTLLDQPAHQAQATGWLARARRLVDEGGQECAEQGLLLCAEGFMRVRGGDLAAAGAAFRQAADIGERCRDRDLLALARHGQGRVLLVTGCTAEGFAMLDEVMVGVTRGEVGPLVAGVVYCSVLSACHDMFDLRRAKEWTTALAAWCEAHPDMQPFRGECLVHRSEMLQLQGAWEDAIVEAERACARLDARSHPRNAGGAPYQAAELYRLRGEFDKADDMYRRASQAGRHPHPGLALLRVAQGQIEAAGVAIRHALEQTRMPAARAQVLRAAVDILIAAKDVEGARAAADELARTAQQLGASYLRGASAAASGAVALAAGDMAAAVGALRDACAIWRDLDAPYEVARTRELLAVAYQQLGDEEGGRLELEAAADAYERLGARIDAARVAAAVTADKRADVRGPLTGREVEVLRLIAAGKTNRAIAAELAISEKTVARHVSNILTKLDLPSRSAATAYAYSHQLL